MKNILLNKKIITIFIIILMIGIVAIGFSLYFISGDQQRDVIQDLRFIRDYTQGLIKNTERNIGMPLDAKIYDNNFQVKEYLVGLNTPTSIKFLENNLLILEKNLGKVKLIKNGILEPSTILDVSVSYHNEQGLLGIEVIEPHVFLYYTESDKDGGESIGNHIYKYDWIDEKLTNPKLITKLPSNSLWHNGGKLTSNVEGDLFAVIGDQTPTGSELDKYRILQNVPQGNIDDTSAIFKIDTEGNTLQPMLSENPTENYFAIGIRNSFGLTIDPITGNLWDTENGMTSYDEVNLVEPKFNSGWIQIMGPASEDQITSLPSFENFIYSDPEFSWEKPTAPTDLIFPTSTQFEKYNNSLFVGDCFGNIYKFTLNSSRTGFVFQTPQLSDLTANLIIDTNGNKVSESIDEILFGTGFGCITDLEFGPDGLLYVVSLSDNTIYKIGPR
jgi:glucose/arabinose dehydrogenase